MSTIKRNLYMKAGARNCFQKPSSCSMAGHGRGTSFKCARKANQRNCTPRAHRLLRALRDAVKRFATGESWKLIMLSSAEDTSEGACRPTEKRPQYQIMEPIIHCRCPPQELASWPSSSLARPAPRQTQLFSPFSPAGPVRRRTILRRSSSCL